MTHEIFGIMPFLREPLAQIILRKVCVAHTNGCKSQTLRIPTPKAKFALARDVGIARDMFNLVARSCKPTTKLSLKRMSCEIVNQDPHPSVIWSSGRGSTHKCVPFLGRATCSAPSRTRLE